MLTKTQHCNLDEAILYAIKPRSRSEMSELQDSGDEDYEPEFIDRAGDSEEEVEKNKKEPQELPENDNQQKIEEEPEEKEKEKK